VRRRCVLEFRKGDPDRSIGFDGKSSYAIASRPRDFDFPASAPFTIEVWARRLAIPDGGTTDFFQHLVGNSVGSPPNRNGFLLYTLPSGPNSAFEYSVPNGGQYGMMGRLAEVSTYAHYAAVLDGKTASLYVDASLTTSKMVGDLSQRAHPSSRWGASSRPASIIFSVASTRSRSTTRHFLRRSSFGTTTWASGDE
jgi:hypothetical protein